MNENFSSQYLQAEKVAKSLLVPERIEDALIRAGNHCLRYLQPGLFLKGLSFKNATLIPGSVSEAYGTTDLSKVGAEADDGVGNFEIACPVEVGRAKNGGRFHSGVNGFVPGFVFDIRDTNIGRLPFAGFFQGRREKLVVLWAQKRGYNVAMKYFAKAPETGVCKGDKDATRLEVDAARRNEFCSLTLKELLYKELYSLRKAKGKTISGLELGAIAYQAAFECSYFLGERHPAHLPEKAKQFLCASGRFGIFSEGHYLAGQTAKEILKLAEEYHVPPYYGVRGKSADAAEAREALENKKK